MTQQEDSIVKGQVVDRSRLFVMLLEKCNFSCRHCAWMDGRIENRPGVHPGYRLSFEQLRTCLADAQGLQSIRRIHFSGGETTLWKDGECDLADLLIEVAAAGIEPSFVTNGSGFVRFTNCRAFLEKYLGASDRILHISLSLDTFHGNFDPRRKRAESLDNLIEFRKELPVEKQNLLDLKVNVCVSKEPGSLLPEEMVNHYRSCGIDFMFHPLGPFGKAKSIHRECPDMEGDSPYEMGAFYPFLQQYDDYMKAHPPSVQLWGRDYFLQGRKIAELGRLEKSHIDAQVID